MPALIRTATPADIPAIAAIYDEAALNGIATFELEPPGEAEMERRRRTLTDGGFPYLAAEESGIVVGYAYAGPYRERRAYRNTLEDSVYLAAAARGRGIGSALLGELLRQSEALGFRQMIAVIGDSANAGSIRLHARLGFAMVGTFHAVGWKHGRWLDTVLMQIALGAGDREAPTRP